MAAYTEADLLAARRTQLVRLARWAQLGRLAHLPTCCVARTLRLVAPSLSGQSDHDVMTAFGTLCVEVLIVDGLTTGGPAWCSLMQAGDPAEALAAAQLKLDCTLAALVPEGAP